MWLSSVFKLTDTAFPFFFPWNFFIEAAGYLSFRVFWAGILLIVFHGVIPAKGPQYYPFWQIFTCPPASLIIYNHLCQTRGYNYVQIFSPGIMPWTLHNLLSSLKTPLKFLSLFPWFSHSLISLLCPCCSIPTPHPQLPPTSHSSFPSSLFKLCVHQVVVISLPYSFIFLQLFFKN